MMVGLDVWSVTGCIQVLGVSEDAYSVTELRLIQERRFKREGLREVQERRMWLCARAVLMAAADLVAASQSGRSMTTLCIGFFTL